MSDAMRGNPQIRLHDTQIHRIVVEIPDPELPEWSCVFHADWEPVTGGDHADDSYVGAPEDGGWFRVTGPNAGTANYILIRPDEIDGFAILLRAMRTWLNEHKENEKENGD